MQKANHPGVYLKVTRRKLRLRQSDVAEAAFMKAPHYNKIENGHCSLSAQAALRIGKVLSLPADMLYRMQMDYDMQQAEEAIGHYVERIKALS